MGGKIRSWIRSHPRISLFALALILRLAWATATRHSLPVGDARWYWSAAGRLFRDHAYTDRGALTAYWPVGYPFFLAAFAPLGAGAGAAVVLVQAMLSSFIAVMLFDVVSHSQDRGFSAWAAALGFAVFPSAISLPSLFLSETVFTFLLFAAFWSALCRPGWKGLALASISMSAACYFRPVALLLLPALYGPMLASGSSGPYLRRTGWVAGLILLTALPWAVRNYRAFGGVCAYATNFGVNLFIAHNEGATGGYMEPPALDSVERRYPNELERSHRFQDLAVGYAFGHPLRELALVPVKAYKLLIPERDNVYASLVTSEGAGFGRTARVLAFANNAYYLAWFALFLATPWWREFRSRPVRFWLGLGFWIQIAFYLIFFAVDRYKLPALPLMFAVAAWRLSTPLRTAETRGKIGSAGPPGSGI